jgi:hypothetical protein
MLSRRRRRRRKGSGGRPGSERCELAAADFIDHIPRELPPQLQLKCYRLSVF